MIPARVQEKLSNLANAPTMDEWVDEHLSKEHNTMYKALMQLRYTTKEQFSVGLFDLSDNLGYARRETAKDRLLADFKEGVDFVSLQNEERDADVEPRLLRTATQSKETKICGITIYLLIHTLKHYLHQNTQF